MRPLFCILILFLLTLISVMFDFFIFLVRFWYSCLEPVPKLLFSVTMVVHMGLYLWSISIGLSIVDLLCSLVLLLLCIICLDRFWNCYYILPIIATSVLLCDAIFFFDWLSVLFKVSIVWIIVICTWKNCRYWKYLFCCQNSFAHKWLFSIPAVGFTIMYIDVDVGFVFLN